MEGMENKIRNLKKTLFAEGLAYIFTDWQIKIILKRLDNQPLTNSEKAEFSRNIKKKVIAVHTLKDLVLILF